MLNCRPPAGKVPGAGENTQMSEILIVDDMASNRYILRSLLEEAGYRVREATDGLQAVDAATEFPIWC